MSDRAFSMPEVTKEALVADLARIDQMLEDRALGPGSITLAGSSATLLQDIDLGRLTLDVDVLRCSPNVLDVMGSCTLDFNNTVSTFDRPEASFIKTTHAGPALDNLEVECVTPESVAIMKLIAGRTKDTTDVARMAPQIDAAKVSRTLSSLDFAMEMPDNDTLRRVQAAWKQSAPEAAAPEKAPSIRPRGVNSDRRDQIRERLAARRAERQSQRASARAATGQTYQNEKEPEF